MAGREAREDGVVFFPKAVGKNVFRGAQKNKQLASPEQNVEEPAALKIIKIRATNCNFKGPAGAFLDESAKRRQFEGHTAWIGTTRVDALEVLVAQLDEMVDAKILLSQLSGRRAFTKIHRTDSVLRHLQTGPQCKLEHVAHPAYICNPFNNLDVATSSICCRR